MPESAAPRQQAPLEVAWHPREPPLQPAAVLGIGGAGRRLARRVLRQPPEASSSAPWTGVVSALGKSAGPPVLLLLGEDLPWVPGVTYFGRDPRAPALLLPTHRQPDIPPALLHRAVRHLAAPVLVAPHGPRRGEEGLLISASDARPVSMEKLRTWLAALASGEGR